MARIISAASLDKLSQRLGTEPINIIEIQWVEGGPRDSYADRDIEGGIKGKILEVGGLDNIIQVSGSSESQQVTVKVDDTDGSVKSILDNNDIHKRPCWVYQWFEGLATSEKFLIFKGQISSPLVWNERDRTVTFDVISRIEDAEIGFSIEEGDFPGTPEDLIGKPWPLCFGTCINIPALRTRSPFHGTLASGVGIRDFTLETRIARANGIICPFEFKGFTVEYIGGSVWGPTGLLISEVWEPVADCVLKKCETIANLQLDLDEQKQFEPTIIKIFGGERFPQFENLTLSINGGKFNGFFNGDLFTIEKRQHPELIELGVPFGLPITAEVIDNYYKEQEEKAVSLGCGGFLKPQKPTAESRAPNRGPSPEAVEASEKLFSDTPTSTFFWANAGSEVTIAGDEEVIYIANILPSTILRVAAYREFNGNRVLIDVPSEFYTVRQVDYTGYQVMELVFSQPLRRRGQGWDDNLYVTLTSSIGPNTVDILEWLISTYTGYEIDETSFNHVRALIENYPSHFPILERKNLLAALSEISYQARCAIWLRDDRFFIRYLPEDPTPDGDIEESDVLSESLEVFHTPTEELVTKYVAEWRADYAIEDSNKIILRHNIKKYGTHEATENVYIYNIHQLVLKSATFWLIRRANTWRKAKFTTPISKLALEVFDTVSLTVPSIADGTIKAIVEQANYNSDTKEIEFEVWTPLKSGTKTPYLFAWPADIEEQSLFPTIDEREQGFAGSGEGPSFSTRPPPGHAFSVDRNLIQSISLACNGDVTTGSLENPSCRSDHGDKKPSDRGDEKPEPKAPTDQGKSIDARDDPAGQRDSACCDRAIAIANQALAAAKKAEQKAADAQDDRSGETDDLPEPEDPIGNCQWKVTVDTIIPTSVSKPEGSPLPATTSEPGAQGRLATHETLFTEAIIFNSESGANSLVNQLRTLHQLKTASFAWIVGEAQTFNETAHYVPGQDSAGNLSSSCEQPAEFGIVAYEKVPA